MIDATQVRETAEFCTGFLDDHAAADWTVAVPDLEMTVAGVVGHIATGCLWYAIDLSAGGKDLTPLEHTVKVDSSPSDLIDTLRTCATMVATVVEVSPASARGFHPMGTADPSGFAAMACDEMLIHTNDAALALGASFEPPRELALATLTRLFPWVAPTDNPWPQLLWANGRISLDDQPRLTDWRWHCAPLAEA